MTVGGWFDAENLFGALETLQERSRRTAPDATNMLVMGPWVHGGWSARRRRRTSATCTFNAKTAEFYREQIEFPFFEYHLKGKGDGRALPRRGSSRPARTSGASTTPGRRRPRSRRSLYLHADGKLSFETPPDAKPEDGFDEYVSDPAKPVPYIDKIDIGMTAEYMTADQRFAARRPDVLVYQTDAAGRRPDRRRPDRGRAARLDDRAPTPTGSSS